MPSLSDDDQKAAQERRRRYRTCGGWLVYLGLVAIATYLGVKYAGILGLVLGAMVAVCLACGFVCWDGLRKKMQSATNNQNQNSAAGRDAVAS